MALEIFKLVGSIFVNTDEANKSISKTSDNAEGLGKKLVGGIGTAAKWGMGMVAAAGTAGTAIVAMSTKTAQTADEIDKMSQKIGIGTEAYQEWSYVMGQNGMDIDKLQTGMKTLVSQMDSAAGGTASAVENFDKLGISIYDSSGKLKDQETMLNETMHALAEMESGTEKARLATELFGKAGSEMMPMLNQGAGSMDELTQRAHDLGLIMSEEAVGAGVKLGDTLDDVKQAFGMMATNLGSAVIPIVQQFAEMILDNLPMIQEMVGQFAPVITSLLTTIAPVLFDMASQILPIICDMAMQLLPLLADLASMILPIIVQLFQTLIPPLMQIAEALFPALTAIIDALMPILKVLMDILTPIIQLFVELIAPIISLIAEAVTPFIEIISLLITESLKPLMEVVKVVGEIFGSVLKGIFSTAKGVIDKVVGVFKGITTFLKGVFTGDFKMAFQGIVDIVKNIFGGIIEIVKFPINTIIDLINGFIDGINKIQIPDWIPGIGGKGLNIGHIKKLYNGGMTGSGQIISTNEKEPELVGNYGAKTLVINNAQIIETMVGAISSTMEKYIDRMTERVQSGSGQTGDMYIPISIGGEVIEELVVRANQRVLKRSGGRINA